MPIDRTHWLDHVARVVRSRHYAWLPDGLGGEDVETAMSYLTADIMHVCKLSGIKWQSVLERAGKQFDSEELSATPKA